MCNKPGSLFRTLAALITVVGSITMSAQSDCAYTLRLFDSAGDGWGGSQVAVIRGTVGAMDTTYYSLATGSEQQHMIEANISEILVLRYYGTGPDQEQNGVQMWLYGAPQFSTFDLLAGEHLLYAMMVDCMPQPFEHSECMGAHMICSNLLSSFGYSLSTPSLIADIDGTNGGCITQENRGAWFWLNIESSGELELMIHPISGPFGDMRMDFAIWPMLTGDFCPVSGPPIRCSAADVTGPKGLVNGATDVSQDATGDGWLAPLPVSASWFQSEQYILYVDNPTAYNFNITLEFTGTAQPGCTVTALDVMTATSATPVLWPNPAEGTVRLSWIDGIGRPLVWRVLDATGRLILEGRDPGEGMISIEPLVPAPYVLQWQDVRTGATGAARFVKQ